MSSGTLSDKVSALTLVIQESPVHTTGALESLLGLAKKRSRGQAVIALGAMKDLMAQGVVLPPDRKLKPFVNQPGILGAFQQIQASSWKPGSPLPKQLQEAHLVSWAYEDWLKGLYFEMLKVLETWCNDEVEFARGRAVGYVWELLKEKPEQESNLLRLLVNKLGDPSRKIASKASFLLLQLYTTHPLMKPIIISSIESEVLFRPGQSLHAKYYAIITLNQTTLSNREENVANKLIEIYFSLFIALLREKDTTKGQGGPKVNKKGQPQGGGGTLGKNARRKAEREEEANKSEGEMIEKLISAVLTGVNRAFPFSRSDDSM
jgi:ribosome biogenesis protein MAK21